MAHIKLEGLCCVVQAGVADATEVQSLLQQQCRGNDELVVGQLENGFRYVIMPNKTPPQRFEAHLEIHAGSVDELPHEQVCMCGAAPVKQPCSHHV